MRKMLIIGVASFVVLYLAVVLALALLQRSLIYPAPPPTGGVPAGFETTWLKTEDGLDLKAAYRVGRPELPVILFLHGNGDNLDGAESATHALGAAGFGRLLVEYRGYGGNPGKPTEQGLYRDGRAALGWLRAQGIAPGRVVLIGNSLGSGTATQLATEQDVAGLVLVSGFTSLPAAASGHYPWLPVSLVMLDRYDNLGKLGAITAPVLLLHGTADTLIPAAHAQRLAAVARHGTLELVEGRGHDLAYQADAQVRIVRWLGQLPGR